LDRHHPRFTDGTQQKRTPDDQAEQCIIIQDRIVAPCSLLPLRACPVAPDVRWPGCASEKVATQVAYACAMHLGLIAVVVSDYDPAISFFVDALGFELVEDSPSLTNDGRPKRWVVVRPPGAVTGLLLARADGEDQATVVGKQAAGRVGFFLHVEDFDAMSLFHPDLG
jgi:hypothetical protein